MRTMLTLPLSLLFVWTAVGEEPPLKGPAIVAIEGVPAQAAVFRDATRQKPLVFKTAEQAAKYFEEQALQKLKKKVDFDNQILLVFAWRGSGQDQMTYLVAESWPEQIRFKYQPGRTRDLRSHVKIYALRRNVTWSVD
jgi:hypothetical protein